MIQKTKFPMKKEFILIAVCCLIILTAVFQSGLSAQSAVNRDTMLVAARELMKETSYCGLVTMDSTGQPQIRTMNPFPVGEEFVIWFATSRSSRKVREIRENPKVCVYYADHVNAKGYVNITGTAVVLDDKELLNKKKRAYWESIPDWQNKFVLIKIVPKTLEVINYKHGLNNDPVTFKAPVIVF
jgi:general stress protein 26